MPVFQSAKREFPNDKRMTKNLVFQKQIGKRGIAKPEMLDPD